MSKVLNQQALHPGNTSAAIIVAAGRGERMGGETPKQYRALGGKPVLCWSVEAMLRCEGITTVVVVVGAGQQHLSQASLLLDPRIVIVEGGSTRTDSVRNGLAVLASHPPAKVLIHDAARPGLSLEVIDELITALDQSDAAAPALPMTDAVKETGDTLRTVARERLVRIQTPQAFRYNIIASAYEKLPESSVDDLALIEAAGAKIVLTPGRAELMKITHAEDMSLVEKLMGVSAMRVGTGFDVHGFVEGDGIVVCGVKIPHAKKLDGHSDSDVGWHALTDAILGAAALGDIGEHFSPSDARWKGADSLIFLQHAARLAAEKGLKVVNADITIICERPKITPHKIAMRARTAEALGVDIGCISVKATTTEKLGFTGREEGIAAQAVVLMAG